MNNLMYPLSEKMEFSLPQKLSCNIREKTSARRLRRSMREIHDEELENVAATF
jgi:hypothetical protein